MSELEKRKCKGCSEEKPTSEFTQVFVKSKWYYKTKCKVCTARIETTKRSNNPEQYRKIQEAYRRRVGMKPKLTFNSAEEQYRNKLANKYKYKKRIKHCRNLWDLELTDLVTSEAHSLRLQRNKNTNLEWHVDHILPINGRLVSGLHVWNNLQVIPAVVNMRKGNRDYR